MLQLTEGVYIYQQIAVVTSIIISLTLIFVKVFHIKFCLPVNTSQSDIEGHVVA